MNAEPIDLGATHCVRLVGKVRPPADLMRKAREGLSPEGFARLMLVTQGAEPTAYQLCREVEFEREGRYPEEVPPSHAVLRKIQESAAILATAMEQLSPQAFSALMLRVGQRPPTARELCEAVEAERAQLLEH